MSGPALDRQLAGARPCSEPAANRTSLEHLHPKVESPRRWARNTPERDDLPPVSHFDQDRNGPIIPRGPQASGIGLEPGCDPRPIGQIRAQFELVPTIREPAKSVRHWHPPLRPGEDYRWCSYAAAIGGMRLARSGLVSAIAFGKKLSWAQAADRYRAENRGWSPFIENA